MISVRLVGEGASCEGLVTSAIDATNASSAARDRELNISFIVQFGFLLVLFDLTVRLSQELDQSAKD